MSQTQNATNLKQLSRRILLAGVLVWTSTLMLACSERWVDTDSGLDGETVLNEVAQAREASLLSGGDNQFQSILDTPGRLIYYTDGGPNSPMGPAIAAVGLQIYDSLGPEAEGLIAQDLESAVAIYVDDQERASLFIQVTPISGSPISAYFDAVSDIIYADGEMYLDLENTQQPGTVIRLVTPYVLEDGSDLKGNIRFQVYESDGFGNEQWLGQLGAMQGFN